MLKQLVRIFVSSCMCVKNCDNSSSVQDKLGLYAISKPVHNTRKLCSVLCTGFCVENFALFCKHIFTHYYLPEPLRLYGAGDYEFTYVKEINVTKEFLKLDEDVKKRADVNCWHRSWLLIKLHGGQRVGDFLVKQSAHSPPQSLL